MVLYASSGTQEQTCQAISHLARIIRVKAPLLNTPNKNRRVPKYVQVWSLISTGLHSSFCNLRPSL